MKENVGVINVLEVGHDEERKCSTVEQIQKQESKLGNPWYDC